MRYHLREVTQMVVSVLSSQYLVGQRAQELEEVENELSGRTLLWRWRLVSRRGAPQ